MAPRSDERRLAMMKRMAPRQGLREALAFVVVGALVLLASGSAGAKLMSAPAGPRLYGPFEQYWKANGALARFGLPLTGVFPYNGFAAQWFERAVLIYNPNNPDPYKVQQQNLGWMAASARCAEVAFQSAQVGKV